MSNLATGNEQSHLSSNTTKSKSKSSAIIVQSSAESVSKNNIEKSSHKSTAKGSF